MRHDLISSLLFAVLVAIVTAAGLASAAENLPDCTDEQRIQADQVPEVRDMKLAIMGAMAIMGDTGANKVSGPGDATVCILDRFTHEGQRVAVYLHPDLAGVAEDKPAFIRTVRYRFSIAGRDGKEAWFLVLRSDPMLTSVMAEFFEGEMRRIFHVEAYTPDQASIAAFLWGEPNYRQTRLIVENFISHRVHVAAVGPLNSDEQPAIQLNIEGME